MDLFRWIAILVSLAVISPVARQEPAADPPAQKPGEIRIGTYDSRAIAIAYAASKYNPVSEKMKEHQQAKTAGDEDRVKQLEAWGQKHQRQLHRQGFSEVPVNDLLAHVKGQLPDVARRAGVVAIVRKCDFTAADVATVDLTNELVALYEPSEKTLGFVESLKGKAPVDLDEIEKHNQEDDF